MSCTICGYGFPIADGDAVTLDFEKAKEFLKSMSGHSVRRMRNADSGCIRTC